MGQEIKPHNSIHNLQLQQILSEKSIDNFPLQKIDNSKKKISGHWNKQENIKYLVFVKSNKKMFSQNHDRKVWKIYKVMSLYIQTRNVYQCRNHHQKMIQKYHGLENLIEELQNIYPAKDVKKTKKTYVENHEKVVQQFTPKRIRRNNKDKIIKQLEKIPKIILSQEKISQEKKLSTTSQGQIENLLQEIQTNPNQAQVNQISQYLEVVAYMQQWQYVNAWMQYFGY